MVGFENTGEYRQGEETRKNEPDSSIPKQGGWTGVTSFEKNTALREWGQLTHGRKAKRGKLTAEKRGVHSSRKKTKQHRESETLRWGGLSELNWDGGTKVRKGAGSVKRTKRKEKVKVSNRAEPRKKKIKRGEKRATSVAIALRRRTGEGEKSRRVNKAGVGGASLTHKTTRMHSEGYRGGGKEETGRLE